MLFRSYGALSSLERVSEGGMSVSRTERIKVLNPLDYLPYPRLEIAHCVDSINFIESRVSLREKIACGKKFTLKNTQKGKYIVCFEDFFSIIEVCNEGSVKYILNRIPLC